MLNIETFVVNSFQENTYLIWDADTLESVIVDAGCYEDDEFSDLEVFISDKKLMITGLVNTHCHIDHLLGIPYLKSKYDLELMAHKAEVKLLENAHIMGKIFGLKVNPFPPIDRYIDHGEKIMLGTSSLTAIHVPGHSSGSLAYYNSESGFVLTGDALFRGSIGRTDLPGGDYSTLIESIKKNLMVLPTGTIVFPGHGSSSTIAIEADSNPFL